MLFRDAIIITMDVFLASMALFSAALVRLGLLGTHQMLNETTTIYMAAVFVIVVLFSSHLMDVYDVDKNINWREIIINIVSGSVTSFFLLSVVNALNHGVIPGREVWVFSLCFFALFQFCWHLICLIGKHNAHFSQRVLVLGTGSMAAQIGKMAASNRRNFSFAGYSSNTNDSECATQVTCSESVVPQDAIIGDSSDLLATARRAQADLIVVALSERRGLFPLGNVLRCKLNGIRIMDAPTFYELVQRKLMLESITPAWFIFSNGFRRTIIFSICKRTVDIVLSCIGLILTLPLFPLIALAIKIDSPGPVFFKQVRVGNKEKPFVLYKFRTMRQDAEKATGAVWAEKKDSRVTKLGNVLRGSRIDELPQLINVLKGEMSFIGPRPERPEFVEQLKQVIPYYSKRHFIKPGLTGWAQVRYPYGSSVEDAVEKLRYDLFYIKNVCPFLDTLIFFETIKVVLFGRGGR
jgi:sugar transferase (PEP-CTERM system associated)